MFTFVLVVLRVTLLCPLIIAFVLPLAVNLVANTNQDFAEDGDFAICIRVEKGEVHPMVLSWRTVGSLSLTCSQSMRSWVPKVSCPTSILTSQQRTTLFDKL